VDGKRHSVRPLQLLTATAGCLEVVLLLPHGAAAARGGGGGSGGVGDGRNGHARETMSLKATQKPSRHLPVRTQKRQPRH
jgi:hypothetical protein